MAKKEASPIQEITLSIEGRTPLLMHNVRMANPLDPYARALKALNGQKKQLDVEEFAMQMSEVEFEGGIYWDEATNTPFLPGFNVYKSIIEGGRMLKLGTAIDQATLSYTEKCTIAYGGKHKSPKALKEAGFELVTAVKVGTAMVMRTRPCFPVWATVFTAQLDSTILTPADFARCAEMAGLYKGVGDGRLKGYGKGRFDVSVV